MGSTLPEPLPELLWKSMLRAKYWVHGRVFRHKYDLWNSEVITVGLTGGRYTKFQVLECGCGNKIAFPEENYRTALTEGTDETRAFLKTLGLAGVKLR